MKLHTKLLLLLACLVSACHSAIPQNYTQALPANLIPNIRNIGYSHNQRNLVVLQQDLQSAFYIYDGIRLNNQQTIKISDEIKGTASPSVFAFSHDDSLLVIGTEEGSVFGYKVINDTVSETWSYNITFGQATDYWTVRSISIDVNDNIAVGVKDYIYVLTVPKNSTQEKVPFNQVRDFKFAHFVQTVCWSVLEPTLIIVGTVGELSGNFTLFNTADKTQKQINTEKTLSIALSSDGKTIYKSTVDKNIDVYSYQLGDIPKFVTSLDQTNSSTQIQISGDGQYVGAEVRGGKVMAWRVVSQTSTNLKMQKEQIQLLELSFVLNLNELGSNLALAQGGNDFLIIPKDNPSTIPHFTLCQGANFLNQLQKDCTPCQQNCATCFSSQICISCSNDKFINGDTCSKCNTKLNGCMTCESSEKCLTCDKDTNWNEQASDDGKCTCMETFYDKSGACSECNVFLDCFSCSGQDYCTLCKGDGNFDTKPNEGKCQCINSFWLNSTQCIECSKSITDCIDCTQDGKQCKKCQSPDRKPNPDQTKCQCIQYRYQDQAGQCQLCDQYQNCIQCESQDPNLCIKCDTSKYRKQTPDNGKCVCQDGYYDNQQGKCNLCSDSIPDCATCTNGNNCLTCKNEANFDPKPVQGKCVCVDGWILDNVVCKLCSDQIIGCSTCSSTIVCKTCSQDNHFVKTPTEQGKCVCQSTHWFDGKQCQACQTKTKGCSTCSADGSKCLTCQDPNRAPNQDTTACECKEYFYQDQNEVCQLCDLKQSCLHCNKTDPTHKCFECDSNSHWNTTPADGVCKCMTGYNEYDGKCVLCSIPGCVQCQTQTTCNRCDDTKQFDPTPDHDTCNCIPGTYKSDDKLSCLDCTKSILGCKQCANAADCTLCDGDAHFIPNPTTNKCDCMKSYYLKSNQSCESCNTTITKCVDCVSVGGTSVECKACEKGWGTSTSRQLCIDCSTLSIGCVDCSDSGHCSKCDQDSGFVLNDNVCTCKPGLYLKDKTCLQCSSVIPGCTSCNSESACTTCTNQNHFDPNPNQDHKCSCIQGWALSDKQCKSCTIILGCIGCSDINTCTKCDEVHDFQLNQQNLCQCKPKYWLNGAECKECSTAIYDCQLCSQNGKTCESCTDPNRQLNEDKTQCDCKKFMYEDQNRKCQMCDPYQNCIECSPQGQHECQKCDITKFWLQKPNADGICTCQSSYTQFDHSCIMCQVTGCNQCQQTNKCSQCQTQKKFNEQPVNGVCQCQPNTILDTDSCYFCKQKLVGCTTCSNFTECQQCSTEQFFVLDNITKKCQCDKSHYLVQNQCKDCSVGIKYCDVCIINQDKKQCIKCKKGFEPSQDNTSCLSCQDSIVGCIDCLDRNLCQQCDGSNNFVFNDDKSKCICNVSYFLKDKACLNCSQSIKGCTNCSQDGTQCSNCDEGAHFVLNDDTKKCQCIDGFFLKDQCVTCSSQILGCQSCAQDGSKCIACAQGYFLQEDQCKLCSSVTPGCTKCNLDGTKCSQCNSENFIFNQNTQKCDCISTYFLDNTQCALCSNKFIGCNICNPAQCLQCNPDHFVYNNQTKDCYCEDNYYLDDKDKKCALCSENIAGCEKCSQDGAQCSQCNDKGQFVLDNSTMKCLCKQAFFLEGAMCELCSSKNPGCSKCSQQDGECSECNTNANFIYDSTTKLCSCKQSFYVSSNTECKLCSQTISYCLTCKSNPKGVQDYVPECEKCKEGFQPNQSRQSCYCPQTDKEIVDGQCVDKKASNWIIFVAIGGGVLLIIGVAVFVYLKCKKTRSRIDMYQEMQEGENAPKRSKQQTILTSQNSSNFIKSSGSLDIDQ